MTTRLATPTLESERFILRPVVREDTSALFPTMSDPEQCRYLLDPAFTDPETLADWLCDTEWDGRSWSAIDRRWRGASLPCRAASGSLKWAIPP